MLVGFVSDQRYIALSDVAVLLEGNGQVADVRSSANGAVYADVAPGRYKVSLNKSGYGAKYVDIEVTEDRTHQFRLLTDELLGYAWPKWVRSGEKAEFRVHSAEAYYLSLWRYGQEKELTRTIGWRNSSMSPASGTFVGV